VPQYDGKRDLLITISYYKISSHALAVININRISCPRTDGIHTVILLRSNFFLCCHEMPDHLNIVTAQIGGFFVTSVLYGLYLYTFFQCLYALVRSGSRWKEYSDINWGLVAITLILFVNGTLNVSLGLLRLIQQFSLHIGPVAWVNAVKVV